MANPARLTFFGIADPATEVGSAPEMRSALNDVNEDLKDPERERLVRNSRASSDGWRLSRSSVSTVYHSAQDFSDLMSDVNSDDFSDPLQSPHRSYHSVHENLSYENDRGDIFSSPQGSPVHGKKTKSVAFQDVMAVEDVDFVLVWEGSSATDVQPAIDMAKEKRRIFEKNLEQEGLILDRERMESSNLTFIKIHAPKEVLKRYAEILKLRMPMKQLDVEAVAKLVSDYDRQTKGGSLLQILQLEKITRTGNALLTEVKSCLSYFTEYFTVDPRLFPPKNQTLNAVYSRDKEYLFDTEDDDFFTPLIRAQIVHFILRRKRYSDGDDPFAFGIERLLSDGVYFAAYPLHDGDRKTPGSQRHLLATEWASLRKCLKYQPIDDVKEYFGVKIALYFAWLGFYTNMLIPAAALGLICFLYGCFTLYDNKISEDICNSTLSDQINMCPLCDHFCDYWKLENTCFYARLTYLFDNDATVFFAILMSFWSAIFLENWKRYAAEIRHRWDLTNFDIREEHPRPEYHARLQQANAKKKVDPITMREECHVPFWRMRVPYTIFSFSMVFFLVLLAVAAVVGVVVYRLVFMYFLVRNAKYSSTEMHSWGLILVNGSAATINLVFIFFFNWLYGLLAEYLTELELHRTQTSFDDSLTLKMYLLQFVNYYSSIFYVAFLKGKFTGSPCKYTRIFGYRQEECGPGGCMAELCIQLAIIMVGKQAMNSAMEMLWPLGMKWWGQLKIMTGIEKERKNVVFSTQWAKDVKLLDWGPRALFPEYLEMVLQYGFVTIFVAAFPLAPLFALLNNILEMRLDAKKLITYYRRPVSQRVKDIGIWYGILDAVGKLAVISNAFIIAFTSNFIPKLVYMYDASHGSRTLENFLNHSLATFNTADFGKCDPSAPFSVDVSAMNSSVTVCRYQQYRGSHLEGPDLKYKRTAFYWKVWMARLAFVVIFENVVALCVMVLRWIIPDVPKKIEEEIRRENYVTNEIIIKQEIARARGTVSGDSTDWNPVSTDKELIFERSGSFAMNNIRKRAPDSGEGQAEAMV